MRGGFREKIIDAGRDAFPPLGPELTGDASGGGDGVSGGGCHWGGVSDEVTLATLATGVTLLDNFLLSFPEA